MLLRIVALLGILAGLSFADTLYLRSGVAVQGTFAGGDSHVIKILIGDRTETYRVEEVARLEFGGTPPAGAPAASTGPDLSMANRLPPAGDAYAGIEIPSGTNLIIRMLDSVDSEHDSVGKTFRATIDEPVMVNGQVAVPRGAEAVTKLIVDTESGKFTGKTALTLGLQSLQINGRVIDITTSEVTKTSASRTSHTAKTVGGGAVVGAVLGGIIAGGKGAVIGAATGGAIGAGADILTKGQKVKIPSETRLSFLLQRSLRP